MSDIKADLSRRCFVKSGVVAVAGLTLTPSELMAASIDKHFKAFGETEEELFSLGAQSFNGMGKVTLEKNIVGGVNILTQNMINKANTVYLVKYDFVLGANITIPKGCVLVFDGGCISGAYTLKGNRTSIKAGLVKIFETDVFIDGTWRVAAAYPEWFGAIVDEKKCDSAKAINKCQYLSNNIYLSQGIYYVSSYEIHGRRKCVICFREQCLLRGSGRDKTQIKYIGGDDVIILYFGGSHSELSGFSVEGRGVDKQLKDVFNIIVTNGIGILLKDYNMRLGEGFVLNNIKVRNIEIGVRSSSYMTMLQEVHCDNCRIGIDTYCANANDGGNALTMTMFNIANCFTTNCEIGYNLWAIRYSVISNSGSDYTKLAYNISKSDGVTLIGCGTEGVEKQITITESHSISIKGCRLGYGTPKELNSSVISVGTSNGIVIEESTIYAEGRASNAAIELLTIAQSAVVSLTIRNCIIDGGIKNYTEWKNLLVYNNSLYNNLSETLNYISESFSNAYRKKLYTFNTTALDAMGFYASENSGKSRPEGLSADAYSYGKSFFDLNVNKQIFWNGKRWVEGDGKAVALRSGNSFNKPKSATAGGTLTSEDLGLQYFDTDLGKPVFVKSIKGKTVVWVDANGNKV